MAYTNIPKPTSTTYTTVNKPGSVMYDESTLTYNDLNTFYDGINSVAYTNIPKPSSTAYTNIPKPT